MKIILISIGTRGDMEPFLAIGELLQEKGHQVICAFPEQFTDLADDSNLTFASLGPEYIKMLESDLGEEAFGGSGSGLKKFLAYIKLARKSTGINKVMLDRQFQLVDRENPDRIIYNSKAVFPIIWELNNCGKTILVSPVPYLHYVRDHTHVAFNSNLGPFLNKLTYALANFGMAMTVKISMRWLKFSKKLSRKQIKKSILENTTIYTISPALFPRPAYWSTNLKILGYQQRQRSMHWQPDDGLNGFLQKHDKILFVTFGSMTNPEPTIKTGILIDILKRHQIPAIINTASGGLVKPDTFDPERLHFVSRIPYDWIFPKMYAVIHHGGSGTTHLALKYGCATMVIPHIIDQFVWNKIIYQTGVGPIGIRINKLSIKKLEPKILALMTNAYFKKRAKQIAGQISKEDFREDLFQAIVK